MIPLRHKSRASESIPVAVPANPPDFHYFLPPDPRQSIPHETFLLFATVSR